jgi:mannose-6-phosphate isomerase-like protein (cupin superfamily)
MDSKWAAFRLPEIEERRRAGDDPWLELLKVPSLRTGLYVLAAGAVDTQSPHTEDEVYYVVRGRGRFTADGDETAVEAGAVLFVAAGVEHRFHSIEEDLEILVFFSSTPRA